MTYKTLKGYTYVVTSSEAVTITDSNGLVLDVPAGEQRPFTATTTEVNYSAPCTITQVRGNFSLPPSGAGGGYPAAPVPTVLTPTTAMRNGGVYTVVAAFVATTLSLPPNATAEIWVRIGATAFNVSLPDSWVWVNGEAADMTGKTNTTFCIAVRNDGVKMLASMAYSYDTTPALS